MHIGTKHRWISLLKHNLCKHAAASQLLSLRLQSDNLGFHLDLQVGGENRYTKQVQFTFSEEPFNAFFSQFISDADLKKMTKNKVKIILLICMKRIRRKLSNINIYHKQTI